MESSDRERVWIDRLSDDQRRLLQTYLNGAAIPFELTHCTVSVEANHIDDLYAVLKLVGNAEPKLDHNADQGDEPNASTSRPPLVPERPAIVHGRPVASPTRRLVGGLIDWLVITVGTVIASRAGAPNWLIVAAFGVYVVIATAVVGRTIGKLVVGTKVIAADDGRVPGFLRSSLRWLAVSWGAVLELAFGRWPIGIATAIFVVQVITYAPILWDISGRGWHDRVADTIVLRGAR
jgi:uncharacterized RDD family membrane protein YckC